jgi:hypothetical protein
VELRLPQMNPDEQLDTFVRGQIEIGFLACPGPDRRPAFNESIVYTDYLMLALPANHALSTPATI